MSAPSLESSGSGPAIECRGVSAGYDGSRVLRHISFQITEPAIYYQAAYTLLLSQFVPGG